MKEYIITVENINKLATQLIGQGWRVISEASEGTCFNVISEGSEMLVRSDSKPTNLSMKQYFFPKSESIFYYKRNKNEIEIIDPQNFAPKTVIFGAKPCDTAAVGIMSKVFNWDYRDVFFNKRMENTVIIGMKCGYRDGHCFCTSVGLSPESSEGSDIFMVPLENGSYIFQVVTPKGEEFIKPFMEILGEYTSDKFMPSVVPEMPPKRFDDKNIKNWLDNNFEHPYWKEIGELCLGCAECAYVCPTCHCFDIVDESYGFDEGRRVKNWDCCQFGIFTKHASGHNPRNGQAQRFRQRISHKFKYYPDKFNEILCTGCGRCSRGCGVGIDICELVENIEKL